MIVGIGTDLCVVERFKEMLERSPGIVAGSAVLISGV